MAENSAIETWFVYMICTRCGALYTGISKDVDRRFAEHLARYEGRSKKGAKYFAGRAPERVVYQERHASHNEAAAREWAIKQLTAPQKRALIAATREA